ncbi:baculoviral IAP repeat-containing protein 3-like [Mytilus trossulus]|uniref:baculoviral IAP repeat-containing protein 3-like n=1 Tax=Mytilus trossulus TaxID=6551 RepID=UPI003004F30D
MLSVMRSPSLSRGDYDDVSQHPLERLHPLRVDVELRRNTFTNWPTNMFVSPGKLCDNGFYYMGITDKVQCAFCGGILSGWTKDDDVHSEHSKHFSQCELVRVKNKNCVRMFEFSNSATVQTYQKKENKSPEKNVKPHNSQYSLYCDRLSTYQSWPRTLKQKPNDLAATGLYYKGTRDTCQCFMCGGILSGWDTEDIPQAEHKKWFPKCPLVSG